MSGSHKLPEQVPERHEALYWEARAQIMWGTAPGEVRTWLMERGLSDLEADGIVRLCIRERGRVMRRKGIRDVSIGGLICAVALVVLIWEAPGPRFVIGGGLSVFALILVFRGVGRILKGSRSAGSVTDSEDDDDIRPWL
jgi:hypothetical protein